MIIYVCIFNTLIINDNINGIVFIMIGILCTVMYTNNSEIIDDFNCILMRVFVVRMFSDEA